MTVRVALVALAYAVVAGCAHTPSDADASRFPPRPVDVRTADLDPCSVLSPSQGRTLGLEQGERRDATVSGTPSPACLWLSETDLSYSVQTIPIGAETAVTEPAAEMTIVNGFGAIRSIPREMTGGTPFCQVTVDAGPGQSIRVQAQGTGARPRSDEEMCRIATDVAAMVMATVVASAR